LGGAQRAARHGGRAACGGRRPRDLLRPGEPALPGAVRVRGRGRRHAVPLRLHPERAPAGQRAAARRAAGAGTEAAAGAVTHPTGALSDVVHHRHRLGILTIASEAEQVEFGYLRQALDLTAGNLNRHLAVLEDAGLVAIVKGYAGRRPKTWVRITRGGRKALAGEMAVLEGLVRTHRRQATGSEQAGSRQAVPGRPEPGQPGA